MLLDVDRATHVAFACTEDGLAPGGRARVHFVHLDPDDPQWGDPANWVDESDALPDHEGDETADDELSAIVFENRVFLVIETEPLGDSQEQARPQLVVYERETNAAWRKHVLRRYGDGAVAKRPVVAVDAAARLLIVGATTNARQHADLWYAPIDSLAGRDEQWFTLRIFEVDDPDTESIYNLRLPRFPVDDSSHLLALIDDAGVSERMWTSRPIRRGDSPFQRDEFDPGLVRSERRRRHRRRARRTGPGGQAPRRVRR